MPRRIFCIEPPTYQRSNSRQQILFCYLLRFPLLRPNTESILFWPTNRVSSKRYDDCLLKSKFCPTEPYNLCCSRSRLFHLSRSSPILFLLLHRPQNVTYTGRVEGTIRDNCKYVGSERARRYTKNIPQ